MPEQPEIRLVKLIELNLTRDVKDYKKIFYKYMAYKMKTKKNVD